MGFTIKCDKCGTENSFKDGDRRWSDNIEIEVEQGGYMGGSINGITIYCENTNCNHYIDIEY